MVYYNNESNYVITFSPVYLVNIAGSVINRLNIHYLETGKTNCNS